MRADVPVLTLPCALVVCFLFLFCFKSTRPWDKADRQGGEYYVESNCCAVADGLDGSRCWTEIEKRAGLDPRRWEGIYARAGGREQARVI